MPILSGTYSKNIIQLMTAHEGNICFVSLDLEGNLTDDSRGSSH